MPYAPLKKENFSNHQNFYKISLQDMKKKNSLKKLKLENINSSKKEIEYIHKYEMEQLRKQKINKILNQKEI